MKTLLDLLAKIGMTITGCGIILLILAMIIFVPFLLVWSLYTLFPDLAITYNIKTWLAALIIMSIVKTPVVDND